MNQSPKTNIKVCGIDSIELKGEFREATPVEIETFLQFLAGLVKRNLSEVIVNKNQNKAS